MFYTNITRANRPPFFHSFDYEPDYEPVDNAYAVSNLIREKIPDYRKWLFDRLMIHGQLEIRNRDRLADYIATLTAAIEYDRTTHSSTPHRTVVTDLYVSELLVKCLLIFLDRKIPNGHGYRWHHERHPFAASVKTNGLAGELHALFYENSLLTDYPLDTPLGPAEDFMRLLPELYGTHPGNSHGKSNLYPCSSDYNCTGAHVEAGVKGILHHVVFSSMNAAPEATAFPELEIAYDDKHFLKTPLHKITHADTLIATTSDLNGKTYAMSFVGAQVPKMQDIEIRYYLMFVLGSIARYAPSRWFNLINESPILFYKTQRFLEHNQIMLPLLALRYMTGRTYSFAERALLH